MNAQASADTLLPCGMLIQCLRCRSISLIFTYAILGISSLSIFLHPATRPCGRPFLEEPSSARFLRLLLLGLMIDLPLIITQNFIQKPAILGSYTILVRLSL